MLLPWQQTKIKDEKSCIELVLSVACIERSRNVETRNRNEQPGEIDVCIQP